MIDLFGKKRIAELEAELASAKREGIARGAIGRLVRNYVNTLPDDQRRNYVSSVVGAKQFLKPQLESMVVDQRESATRYDISEKERMFYISNLNCLQLLLDWFEAMTSENQANIEEMRRKVEADATLVEDVKSMYNLNP